MTRQSTLPRPRHDDDAAVSSVLGAVLMFGLLVITLVTIQVKYVPVWSEDREARHMDQVTDQLRLLKADLDRQAANITLGQINDPLTLSSSGGFSFFKGAGGRGGEAGFTPSGAGGGVTINSPQMRIIRQGDVPLFALEEQWTDVPVSGDALGITDIDHFRVRIGAPNSENNGDSATFELRDADGDYGGKAVITFLRDSSERSLQTEIFSAADPVTPITVQRESYFHQVEPEYVYVNLLDDELLFGQVLGAIEAPFDILLAENLLNADYTLAFTSVGGGSSGSSGGETVINFAQTTGSGSLTFVADNEYFPEQVFTLEHGALVLEQADGDVILVPPALTDARAGTQIVIDWTVPALQGDSSELGGARAASVLASPSQQEAFDGLAARIVVLMPTEHPGAWETYLDTLFGAAGFTATEYDVAPTANGVSLTIAGPIPAPGDSTEDIVLRYRHAVIDLSLRPSG